MPVIETNYPRDICSRWPKTCGVLSLFMSTLFFFGNISMIVWLFEYKYPVKFSVICFMVASGVLYLTAFTSSLLLLTRRVPGNQRPRTNSDEPPVTHREEIPRESYEMTSNISYSAEPNILQLPPRANVRKTPPPPYDASGNEPNTMEHSTTMDDGQTRDQNRDYLGMTANEVYFGEDERRLQKNEMTKYGLQDGFESQTNQVCDSVPSWNKSSDSNEMRLPRSGNSKLILRLTGEPPIGLPHCSYECQQQHGFHEGLISLERSPRSSRSEIRNPSTALKRKLKTEISKSDFGSEIKTGTSSIVVHAEMPLPHSNFHSNGTSQISRSNDTDGFESYVNSSAESTPRFLRKGEARSSQIHLKPPILTRTSHSSLNMEKILENSKEERKKHDSLSNLNTNVARKQFETKSNWLIPPERQLVSNSNLDVNRESTFAPTERRFSSHSNLKPEIQVNSVPAEQHSSSNFNTEQHSNFESTHQMSSHSSLSHASSCSTVPENCSTTQVKHLKKIFQPEEYMVRSHDMPGLHKARSHGSLAVEAVRSPQELRTTGDGDSSGNDASIGVLINSTGRSGESGFDNASIGAKRNYGTARSIDSGLDDASIGAKRSTVTGISTALTLDELSIGARNSGTGRSIESGFDGSRNSKQLAPQEWMAAWDKGINKLNSSNGKRIEGFRL